MVEIRKIPYKFLCFLSFLLICSNLAIGGALLVNADRLLKLTSDANLVRTTLISMGYMFQIFALLLVDVVVITGMILYIMYVFNKCTEDEDE